MVSLVVVTAVAKFRVIFHHRNVFVCVCVCVCEKDDAVQYTKLLWFSLFLALCLVMPLFLLTDNWAELMEVNHDDKVVTTEHFDLSQEMERLTLDLMKPKSREVERRLTSPVINTSLDTKNIAFERYRFNIFCAKAVLVWMSAASYRSVCWTLYP